MQRIARLAVAASALARTAPSEGVPFPRCTAPAIFFPLMFAGGGSGDLP
jgi:hypothetical protein